MESVLLAHDHIIVCGVVGIVMSILGSGVQVALNFINLRLLCHIKCIELLLTNVHILFERGTDLRDKAKELLALINLVQCSSGTLWVTTREFMLIQHFLSCGTKYQLLVRTKERVLIVHNDLVLFINLLFRQEYFKLLHLVSIVNLLVSGHPLKIINSVEALLS